jgi:AraC family transcriptional regulator of adaptative response/methylated-DNA-[protein]-cysteine methyltransferase
MMKRSDKTMEAATTLADTRWALVLARDGVADGSFYYSVSTTGVYCRPSCPSRTPRAEHVRFHATSTEAE